MAIDDVVSGISGTNSTIDFQPAAGVECVTKCIFTSATTAAVMYDGSNQTAATSAQVRQENMKSFVNNSIYLRILGIAAVKTAYTGVQTK